MGVAFVIFFLLYGILAKGDFMIFLRQPVLIGIMILPFLPAYVFMIMSKLRKKKMLEALAGKDYAQAGDMNKKRTDLYASKKAK